MADQDTPSREIPKRVVSVDRDGVRLAGVSDSVADGRKVVASAGTRVQFDPLVCRTASITAELGNTGVIVVGGPTVVAASGTRSGTPLSAGDTAIAAVSNMNLLYMDATVSGEGVTFTVLA